MFNKAKCQSSVLVLIKKNQTDQLQVAITDQNLK